MMNMDVTSLSVGMLQRLINTVYPPRCVLCGSPGFNDMDICEHCYHDLPWIQSACLQCAIPLANHSGDQLKCGQCLRKAPVFDRSVSLFSYAEEAITLVYRLKFNEKLAYSRLLGSMLADAIAKKNIELPGCILPVPLYKKRLRQRGFNQSLELARPIANRFNIPIDVHAVKRVRDTQSQTGLDKKQRRKNIRAAFKIVEPVSAPHVAVVDDVVTTTSTANELSRLLKRSGVRRVDVWSIARAV
jgi:ComF family protein